MTENPPRAAVKYSNSYYVSHYHRSYGECTSDEISSLITDHLI